MIYVWILLVVWALFLIVDKASIAQRRGDSQNGYISLLGLVLLMGWLGAP